MIEAVNPNAFLEGCTTGYWEEAPGVGLFFVPVHIPSWEQIEIERPSFQEVFPHPEPISEPVVVAPILLRRPWVCHCGLKSRWVIVGNVSHCRDCEPEYRSYK